MSKNKYQEAFNSSEVKTKINSLNKTLHMCKAEDAESLVESITDVMVTAGNISLFRKSYANKKKKLKKVNKRWYDTDCHKLLRDVNSAKNAFNRNNTNASLRIQYYKKFKEYKRTVKLKKRNYKHKLTNLLNEAMDKDPQTAWKLIDELKKNAVPTDKSESINRNEWYNHFNNLLHNNESPIDNQRQQQVLSELHGYEVFNTVNGTLDYDISEKEVLDASKKLKNNKSSADDMLKNEMIKSALPILNKQIVEIFNIIFKAGKFPHSWTQGIIVPVHKQGSKFDANNYRGITLSSCFGKLFCHILNDRISQYLDNISFLKPEQAGFRKNFRTTDHIYVLKTIIDKYVFNSTKGGKIYACFIDLRKAFDTVWHDGLLLKLQKAGIKGNMYNLIKSMYQGSVSRVKCKQSLSDPINIMQGVHQGNILSPLLFNIFMNDIDDSLQFDDVPLLHDYKLNHLLYADDLLLLSTSSSGLQKNIDGVQSFCKKWGLTINSEKSKIMVFSKGGRTTKDKFNFVINNSYVDHVTSYKYLGINISNTGKFALAEKNLSLKASRALFSVKQSVFNNNVKPSVIFKIFDSLIKPIALYGSDVWFGYKKCFYNKSLEEMFEMSFKGHNEFDKIYTRFCKYVLGVHSRSSNFAVYSELGQIPLVISIISSSINFWLHTISSNSDSLLFKAYLNKSIPHVISLHILILSRTH